MLLPTDVDVPTLKLGRFEPLIGAERFAALEMAASASRATLGNVTVWNVNSTANGGGVAEMLRVLVGYIRDIGVDVRWVVIAGDPEFFAITKRLHNRLHGVAGDHGELAGPQAGHYQSVLAANLVPLLERIRPGDVVLLHDPQTAGMAAPLIAAGARVVWRCHIGSDLTNRWTEQAWHFLRPHLAVCDGYVFSRAAYVPDALPRNRVSIIPPSIDPFSAKNEPLGPEDAARILATAGLAHDGGGRGHFTRSDGSTGEVRRAASVVAEGDPALSDAPLVVQVSRWDHLKDMQGVMEGFARHVVGRVDAQLALVGPMVDGVQDDPEGAEVLAECTAAWAALPVEARRRIRLVTLPMDDTDENAAMVNALQRRADVVVQKSLAEGFGLTVAEGMWKAKPLVASAVGGIVDQVAPGTGVLLDDPSDLAALGAALVDLLSDPTEARRLGANARRHVLDGFLGDRHLLQYAQLIQRLVVTPPDGEARAG